MSIEQSQSLKVKAWKSGLVASEVGAVAYELKAAPPSLSPSGGTFASPTSVTLQTATTGAIVRYTLDGSVPTGTSPLYSGPIPISTTTTLRAAAFKSQWSTSDETSGTYAMNFGTLAAPTIEPATGTYVGGVTVTMSSPQSGATIRFTTNGDTPTESSAAYASAISVDGTMTVKARAFRPDYTASGETSHTYTIESASPIINPSTGTYSSEQTVTITAAAGPPSTVRYTLDGSAPTASSPAYTGSFNITTATTVKARSFPNDGSAGSAVASATLSFNLGPLAAPTATPDAGVYADAQTVSLSALSGATIRYTLDGTEPIAVSNLYVTPVPVSADLVIKARAFHPDWTQSGVMSSSYTIDASAPTIAASTFPAPIGDWHSTATTVSFTCEDNVGIASCSSSTSISNEGAGQQIVGTAIDLAGRQATEAATVNLDLTAPTVTITEPAEPLTTSNTSIDLEGEVSDALSGIVGATCNGQPATVVAGVISCTVPLGPGRNDLTLAARDAAGNVASKGIRITRVGTATALGLTPTAKTLVADETTTLTLTDEFGAVVEAATWSSSDPSIVSVSLDDPPLLTALQPGTVTITAMKNALSAQASLTVGSGTSLPYGTTRWSISGGPTSTVSYTIAANRVDLTVPDLFSIESVGTETIVRGITASGDVLWTQQSPGTPIMGDSFGGLVAGEYWPTNVPGLDQAQYGQHVTYYSRFASPEGTPAWRYTSPGGLSLPAQATDGTIYAVERYPTGTINQNGIPVYETQVIVIDGSTGAVRARHPLAREQRRGVGCNSVWEASPNTAGPVVGIDGYGYVAVRRWIDVDPCSSNLAQQAGVDLLRISPAGIVTSTSIYSQECTYGVGVGICDRGPQLKQVIPDGIGGTLVRAFYSIGNPFAMEMHVTRVHDGAVQFSNLVDSDQRITMIDSGTAFLSGDDTRAVDVTNWSLLWSKPNSALAPVATLADGRFAMRDPTAATLTEFAADGTELETVPFSGGDQTAFGVFTKVESTGTAGILTARSSMPLDEAFSAFNAAGGSATHQNNRQTPPGRTIDQDATARMLMDHLLVVYPQEVNGLRIEHAGHICREANAQNYYYQYLRRGTTRNAPGLQLNPERCKSGTTVGYAHSHPDDALIMNLPSGYASQAEYFDVDSVTPDDQRSDLWIADEYFLNPVWAPKGPNVWWYVTAPSALAQRYTKYKRTATLPAKDNI